MGPNIKCNRQKTCDFASQPITYTQFEKEEQIVSKHGYGLFFFFFESKDILVVNSIETHNFLLVKKTFAN